MAITFSALGERGRLGNQLWQVAAAYGIARECDTQIYLPEWDYQPYFSCPAEWWSEAPGVSTRPSILAFEADSDAYVCQHIDPRQRGYLQCWHYIDRVVDDVRRFFQPSDLAKEYLDEHVQHTNQGWLYELPDNSISLHIRRGDNADPKTHPVGTWPLVTLDYYRDALDHIDPDQEMGVVVFSDDIPWCMNNLALTLGERRLRGYVVGGPQRDPEYGTGTQYRFQPALDWMDMQLMTLCKHHILANSTYSWWGAFLDEQLDSKVVYPNHWVGWRIDQYEPRDLMPPHWTEVNNPVHPKHLRKR